MKKLITAGLFLCFLFSTSISFAQLKIKPAIGINFTDFSKIRHQEKPPQKLAGRSVEQF
jgi:hypothetical protein